MWAVLNRFNPRNDLVLSGIGIGMDCMNLITSYMQVPVTSGVARS